MAARFMPREVSPETKGFLWTTWDGATESFVELSFVVFPRLRVNLALSDGPT
jgi:hypothetical protein